VDVPPPAVRQELVSRGFGFLTCEESHGREATLLEAGSYIEQCPSLADTVSQHIGHLSLLRAEEAYDISHSEPRWPDWAFVSVPQGSGAVSALRTADNIVHEAMHLQLTRLEQIEPLIADEGALLWSPWKEELRDLRGNLHAVYVFRCIAIFLQRLLDAGSVTRDGATWIAQRLTQMEEELAAVSTQELGAGLTTAGRGLLSMISAR
jgi:HEXXH motif-containing protein